MVCVLSDLYDYQNFNNWNILMFSCVRLAWDVIFLSIIVYHGNLIIYAQIEK